VYCTPSHHAVGVGHDLAEPERDAQRDGVAVEGVVSGRGQLDVAVRAENGRAVQHHQRVGSDVAVDVHRQAEPLPRRSGWRCCRTATVDELIAMPEKIEPWAETPPTAGYSAQA